MFIGLTSDHNARVQKTLKSSYHPDEVGQNLPSFYQEVGQLVLFTLRAIFSSSSNCVVLRGL